MHATTADLPPLADALRGYRAPAGAVSFVTGDGQRLLSGCMETDTFEVEDFARLLGEEARTVHLIGHGSTGATRAWQWARAIRMVGGPLSVGKVLGAWGDQWVPLEDPFAQPAPVATTAVVELGLPEPAATRGDVLGRLTRTIPGEATTDAQAAQSWALVRDLARTTTPTSRSALAMSALDADWKNAGITSLNVPGAATYHDVTPRSLVAELVVEDAVRDQVIARTLQQPHLTGALVEASRCAHPQTAANLVVAAAAVVWVRGEDGAGPVSTSSVADMLAPAAPINQTAALLAAQAAVGVPGFTRAEGLELSAGAGLARAEREWATGHSGPDPHLAHTPTTGGPGI